MRGLIVSLLIAGASTASAPVLAQDAKARNDCEVVEQTGKASRDNAGALSSSVTAGGGRVSANTTGAGNSVTVRSGGGSTSSSVAIAGGSGGSTVVAGSGSGDDCTITINPKK